MYIKKPKYVIDQNFKEKEGLITTIFASSTLHRIVVDMQVVTLMLLLISNS